MLFSQNHFLKIFFQDKVDREERIVEGHFLSPFVHQVPGVMPKEVEVAR